MLLKMIMGRARPRSVHSLRWDDGEYGQAYPTEPSSPSLIASSVLISCLLSLCSGTLPEKIKGAERKQTQKPAQVVGFN